MGNIGDNQSLTILCTLCGIESVRRGPVQRYCLECSNKKSLERTKSPHARHQRTLKAEQEKNLLQTRGTILSNEAKRSITWPSMVDDDISRLIRVSIPFSWSFSKNAIYSMNTKGSGHVFLRKKANGVRNDLIASISTAMQGQPPFFKGKVWIDILVQKPNNKGDAINVIDSVCDGIKIAIGIDDRYFSIRKLDWEIVKQNPVIFVGIGQTITEDHYVCSYCGRLQPESTKSAHRRTCRQCRHGVEFEKRHD